MLFRSTPCTPKIGGTLSGLHLADLNEDAAADLRQALWQYGVLFVRDQHLTYDQMKKVALVFGDELEQHSAGNRNKNDPDYDPQVLRVEMVYSDTAKSTTDMWHNDVTARKHPTVASVLQAETVPFGADTMWASASAAYQSLPYALKLLFLNIDIEHDSGFAALRHGFVNAGFIAKRMIEIGEVNTHPAVIEHHATGQLCLFGANGTVKRVHQYPIDLSELIIKLANELPRIPEFQVRYQWSPGDVAIWDNFGTWHYGVTSGVRGQHRRLHRVSSYSKSITPTLDRQRAVSALMASGA